MWLVSGPFDGFDVGQLGFERTKLLKTGTKYVLGRKDRPLVINHKKISHDHAEFIVGSYTEDDAANPSQVPTLEIFNAKSKAMTLSRGSETLIINPSATQELQDGDILHLVIGISTSIRWMRVCCYTEDREKYPVFIEACASLGINMVTSLDPHITHHLTPTFDASPSIAHSLILAAQIVKAEWLIEVLRIETTLDTTFVLPPIVKFRPSFSRSLPKSMKNIKVWEPNEERLNMFRGYRFILVGEKGREPNAEVREMIVRGGGEYEGFNADNGKSKWHQVLTKGGRRVVEMAENGKGLVIVGDEKDIVLAAGRKPWKEMVDEAKSFQLSFIPAKNIVESIIHLDPSYLSSNLENIGPDEPLSSMGSTVEDVAVGTQKPSDTPVGSINDDQVQNEESPEPQAPPRRVLTRRAKLRPPAIIGIGDSSSIIDSETAPAQILSTQTTDKHTAGHVAPIPPRSTRLKRRAGTTITVPSSETFLSDRQEVEPPLKKFKALFEASDPGRISGEDCGDHIEASGQSQSQITPQTQTQTEARTAVADHGTVQPIVDTLGDEDERVSKRPVERRGVKRKCGNDSDADDVEEVSTSRKKQVVEGSDAVEVIQPALTETDEQLSSKSGQMKEKSGAAPGKPDVDEAFLKALASTKKGKKGEDSFDREFNKLRISKPDLREEEEKDWAVLENFGDDPNIRGNFMVVVEMDVRKEIPRRRDNLPEATREPNFKKFKRKPTYRSQPVIELVAEDNDYGMGPSYWKGHSQSATSQPQKGSETQTQSRLRSKSRASQKPKVETVPEPTEDEPQTKSSTRKRDKARAAGPRGKSTALFLDSDEEMNTQKDIREVSPQSEALTLRSNTGKTQPRRGKAKKGPAATIIDDDSDEDVTFKGFRDKGRGFRR